MSRIKFLNTYIDNVTMKEAIDNIEQLIIKKNNSLVVTPNLDHIVNLEFDYEFSQAYKNADLILADGKPLIWISKLLKNPIKEKISGSDLFPKLCEMCANKGFSIYILGAEEEIAKKAAQNLCRKYNGLKILGTYSPPLGFENNETELSRIINLVREAKPDVLAVALGTPKGEKFLYKYLKLCNVPLGIQIGATIDFISGNIKRAPVWMREHGLEWLFRLKQEPKRLGGRYFKDAISIIPIYIKYRRRK